MEEVKEKSLVVKFMRKSSGGWVFPKVDDVSEEEMYDCKPVQVTFGRRHYQIIE